MLSTAGKAAVVLVLFAWTLQAQRMAGTFPSLQAFIDTCPQNDPYYQVLRRDFQILKDLVPVGDIACTEPYSQLPVSQVTEELALIQTLRFAYYMDMGQSGYLPWTPLRLYDWLKSRVAGFNVDSSLKGTTAAASCCFPINGRQYITLAPILDDLNRMFRQRADGLAGQVALFSHETRHSEGSGYGHVSCCGTPGGCDQTYDETNLSAYGVQYYLFMRWLDGSINLGYSCDAAARATLAAAFLQVANVYPSRFCDQKPRVVTMPPSPGGACVAACTLALSSAPDSQVSASGGMSSVGISANVPTCGWTADSAENWIYPITGGNTAASGTATYGIGPNQTASVRAGTLITAGLKSPINQPACPSPCANPVVITAVVSGTPGTTAIASGSWVTIFGRNLAATTRTWRSDDFSGKKLPVSLDGVTVRIDGQLAAVYYVSASQLNVQCPDDGATGDVTVQVTNRQGSATATATLQRYAPGFFPFAQYVAAVHADGSFVGPKSLFGPGTTVTPANPGEVVLMFGTGFGPTNPTTGAGVIVAGAASVAFPDQLQIRIGGQLVAIQFAGLTGAGLYQFNVVIPFLPDGEYPVLATIGGVAIGSSRQIVIQGQ